MRGNLAACGALCAAVLFWGLSFTATKVALEHLSPLFVLFARFGLALAILAPLARREALSLPLRTHAKVLAISVLFPGCYFALEVHALGLTSATNASLISAAIPMVVLALSALAARALPSLWHVAGVAASLAGVGLLVGAAGGPVNSGDALMLGAVASASVYMVAASRLRGVSPLALTALQMLWGTLFFVPFAAVSAPDLSLVPAPALASVAGLALFATVGAFLCYNYALTRVSAATAALFINAVPVVAATGAHLALGESVSAAQALGGALILASAYATAAREPS